MSTRRRVLLATPAYEGVTLPFHHGICDLLRTDLGVDLIPSVCRATYISRGRDDLVEEARKHKCDEIFFIDADVQPSALHAARLLSHDVDIVAGCYAKRVPGAPQWPYHATGEPKVGDLVPCHDVATGFLRVKMGVFDALDAKFPFRRYQHDGEPSKMSYFPVMLAAKGSHLSPAESTLAAIRCILDGSGGGLAPDTLLAEIVREMGKEWPSEVTGDDISWARMCRAAGFTVYADSRLRIRHHGSIGFPATETPL